MSIDVWVVALIKHLQENFVTFKRFFYFSQLVSTLRMVFPSSPTTYRRILYSNLCKDIELC